MMFSNKGIKDKGVWLKILLLPFLIPFVACAPRYRSDTADAPMAVWDLDDISPSGATQPELGRIFSDHVVEILKGKSGRGPVVERERLLAILEELNLGTTHLVDEETRLRLGRLVGARLMIFGSYQITGEAMRVDLRLVEVESAKIIKAVQKTTASHDISEWLKAISQATEELL